MNVGSLCAQERGAAALVKIMIAINNEYLAVMLCSLIVTG
jgi:hypothetical protein